MGGSLLLTVALQLARSSFAEGRRLMTASPTFDFVDLLWSDSIQSTVVVDREFTGTRWENLEIREIR